jgi:hypothetical protein
MLCFVKEMNALNNVYKIKVCSIAPFPETCRNSKYNQGSRNTVQIWWPHMKIHLSIGEAVYFIQIFLYMSLVSINLYVIVNGHHDLWSSDYNWGSWCNIRINWLFLFFFFQKFTLLLLRTLNIDMNNAFCLFYLYVCLHSEENNVNLAYR